MFFTDSVFVGIDPTSSRKAFTYAALDRELNLVALTDGEMEDVTAFLAGQKSATVAINAPSNVNCGVVREKMKKEMLTPHQIRGADMRVAEYELREHGITVSGTPGRVELCPSWIQLGFALYRKLEKMGFVEYPHANAGHQLLETHPHAVFCSLVGQVPLQKPTLEGRIQRQIVLHDAGLRIKDPMNFFEEITRHRLRMGIMPMELIYPSEQLDALAAAYTAWLAVKRPEGTLRLGMENEGFVVLPVGDLKTKY
ncbi:MAG: DUF429 domain-containing protein [Chloroflexi bacterium]|nr:DUF429 domain-containing protein [Chloroflexota bacterium]